MRKLIILPILAVTIAMAWMSAVFAATQFVCAIKESGGDYSTLASWDSFNQCDLTASMGDI